MASKADVRKAFKAMFKLPPLSYTDAELRAINIQGHTEPLQVGFSDRDIDALGHWLRDKLAKAEASASEAAAAAAPDAARRAAAIASLPGAPASRGAMRNYYGEGGASNTRFSERWTQLRVRQRLAHTVRALLEGRDWTRLERGAKDLTLLRSL